MSATRFKAAVLDMDGVITRTATVHAEAWKKLFDDFLRKRAAREGTAFEPFDAELEYRRYVDGKPRYDGVQSFLESRGIALPNGREDDEPESETICGLGNRKNEFVKELFERDGVEVYEDAVAQIGKWRASGWKTAVISSSRNCEAVLKAAGVLELFDAKVDGNDLGRLGIKGKPAPDVFLQAAKQLGVQPSEAVVVEDALAGVQAGREGGFGLVVGVERGAAAAVELRSAGADIVVKDLREIDEALSASCDPAANPPSALACFDDIASKLAGRKLALFLDYDGTLSPIVRRPEEAVLSEDMRAVLADLSALCTTAVVSGRDRRNAERLVKLDSLVFAGSHGFDIHGPGGLEMQQEDAEQALPELDRAEVVLTEEIGEIKGAYVERKRYAIAVHYREVSSDKDIARVESAVDAVLADFPELRKRGGKRIFELQPDVEWDKGHAVSWLFRALGFDRADSAVMYIGDDVTDEDAFRVLHSFEIGIGIRVADVSAETAASYVLHSCSGVQEFLELLRDYLREAESTK